MMFPFFSIIFLLSLVLLIYKDQILIPFVFHLILWILYLPTFLNVNVLLAILFYKLQSGHFSWNTDLKLLKFLVYLLFHMAYPLFFAQLFFHPEGFLRLGEYHL